MNTLTRRTFGKSALGFGLAPLAAPFISRFASASTSLTAVEWGTPYIESTKKALEGHNEFPVVWELHNGGSATILAKIEASWPNPPYDLVDVWSPIFASLIKKGWAETVTLKDVPNLADVPASLISKDENGNWKNIPRSVTGQYFAVRTDKCPIQITKIEDLLNPKLKGQILWPAPIFFANNQVTALALARGGDERNIEPGWKFLSELAQSGNIGRVYSTMGDGINSLTTGETSVTFIDQGTINGVSKDIPMVPLVKKDPTLKTFLAVEGWAVLSSSKNKEAAFKLANFLVSPEASTTFNAGVKLTPMNKKATPTEGSEVLAFSDDELKQFAYQVDFDFASSQADAWSKRFESEILPLIQ